MKNTFKHHFEKVVFSIAIAVAIVGLWYGCKKNSDSTTSSSGSSGGGGYIGHEQVNLVSDLKSFGAARIDPNLANPWGIAFSPSGAIWIASNHTGMSVVYDRMGRQLLPPVSIPSNGTHNGGSPTGVIFNSSTTDFFGYKFIFANEDGTISAWSSGDSTITISGRAAFGAIYKGITIANDGGENFLYLANFKSRSIDVFDKDFNYILSKPFFSRNLPPEYAPFNIENIDNKLYVTYALPEMPEGEDDVRGAGNGYVDIFMPDGTFLKHFATRGTLNSPWGIAKAPEEFGLGKDVILIGNFGDGRINIFNSDGVYQGQVTDRGTPIEIEGLWAITFPKPNPGGDPNQLFFTAGPADEEHGVFGYLQKRVN